MSDFALRVKGLPPDSEYGDREHILKAKLWDHFDKLLAKEEREPTNPEASIAKYSAS